MKKHLIAGLLLCAGIALGATQGVGAAPDNETEASSSDKPKTLLDVSRQSIAASNKHDEIEAKKQAIEDNIAEKKAAIAEKLSGKTEERCKQKESTINHVFDTRVSAAQRHFDTFKAVEDKLLAFVAAKKLSVNNASALEVIMTDKGSDAQAAITAMTSFTFVCDEADASAPGALVMDQIGTAKQALKDYRSAIKAYAVAVKNTLEPPKPAAGEDQ